LSEQAWLDLDQDHLFFYRSTVDLSKM